MGERYNDNSKQQDIDKVTQREQEITIKKVNARPEIPALRK
jgi:hypothetical protein